MRKINALVLSLSMLLLAGSAFADPTPPYDSYTDKSANVGKKGTAVRVLKLVRFGATEQGTIPISAGEVLVYDTVSDDGITIRRTTTSGDGAIAGVSATSIQSADSATATTAQDDAGKRNWGWIVVHGPATANSGVGGQNGNAVGDIFITSTDGGMVTTLAATDDGRMGVSTTKKVANKGGFFMNAASSSTNSNTVFVTLE